MRIGLIVDGEAEYRSIRSVLDRVETPEDFIGVRLADIQPLAATREQIVRAVRHRMVELAYRRADRVIVLVDLETRQDCPGDWADDLSDALTQGCVDAGVP